MTFEEFQASVEIHTVTDALRVHYDLLPTTVMMRIYGPKNMKLIIQDQENKSPNGFRYYAWRGKANWNYETLHLLEKVMFDCMEYELDTENLGDDPLGDWHGRNK